MHKLLSEARTRLRYAFSILCLITFLGASADLFAEANYVYHEQTTANPGCGPNYMSTTTPNNAASVQLAWKVEYQFYTTNTVVYYTTDGTNPSGAFGVGTGTTQVLTGSYNCSFGSPVTDVATATIPVQIAGKTVKYIISAWHSGGGDEIFANGPGAPCACGSVRNNSSLATVFTYTVAASTNVEVTATGGTALANYATVKAAFDAVNAGTHTGSITIKIYGNTTETATASLNASGTGSASYTAISVQPAGGASRTVSGAIAGGSPLIEFKGADNVTVDGLNSGGNTLTLDNTTASATSGTCTIKFIDGATSNTVTRCSVKGAFSAAVGTNGGNIFFSTDGSTANGNDNNTISSCDIGPSGANLPTKGIYMNGSTTTTAINNSGNTFNNNNIFDYFGAAVSSAGVYISSGNTDNNITNNKFYQTASRTQTTGAQHSAVWITNTSGNNFLVSGNTIGFASSAGTGTYTFVGVSSSSLLIPIFLNVGTTTSTSVQGNTIAGMAMSGAVSGTSSSAAFRGIYVSAGLTNIGDVTGNTIGSMSATGSITFTSSSTSASDVIAIFNFGSSNWTTNNNNIGGFTVSNSSTGAANFYGLRCNTGSLVTWTCNNNTIGGTIANSINSTSTATGTIVNGIKNDNPIGTITSNTIRNMTVAGGTGTTTTASMIGICVTTSSSNQTVSQNTIFNLSNSNTSAATVVTGIQFTGSTANVVARNLIYGLTSSTNSTSAEINGIRVAGGTTTYRNNMIALGAGVSTAIGSAASNSSTSGIVGINEALGTDNFWHNSVYIGGTATAGSGASFAFNGTQTINTRSFRDNIFVNVRSNSGATGKNYAIKINGTAANPTGLTINNNLYYASGTGSVFGFFNSADVANLTAWKTAVGQDAGSFESDPQYNAPTASTPDLHIHATNPTQAEANGFDLGVTDDYDGQTRSGLTPVDIGADAGNFTAAGDVNAPVITYTALSGTCLTSDRTVTATITDGSGVPTSGVLMPRIYYKKNAGSYTSSAGTLTTGTGTSGTWDFVISAAGLGGLTGGDVISYYIIAQDIAGTPNISSNPAGVVATNVNSITTHPSSPNTYAIGVTSGTYTVGVAGNFTTLTAAVAAYNAGCISGPIVFNLIDATYSSETLPITINAVGGASSTNTLTIKPSTTATISGSSASSVIKLNGADYIIIDGSNAGGTDRSLTITNTNNAAATAAIWVSSTGVGAGATNNIIKNVNLSCGVTQSTSTSTTFGIIENGAVSITNTTPQQDNDNNTYQNNAITKVRYGIFTTGESSANQNQNTIISNNLIGPSAFGVNTIGKGGIVIANLNAGTISGNEVRFVGGDLANMVSGTDRAGITIGTDASWTPTSTAVSNTSIVRNSIHDIVDELTFSAVGIISGSSSSPSSNIIANNMIYNVRADGTSGDQTVGIGISAGNGDKVVYNTVSMTGDLDPGASATSTVSAAGIRIASTTPTNLTVANNIVSVDVTSNTSTLKHYAYVAPSLYAFGTGFTNYNDLYINAANTQMVLGGIGTSVPYTDKTTLATWQASFSPTQEANTKTVQPVFISATDLHLNTSSNLTLNEAATPIASVTTDYDNTTRNATLPDIGADEFTPPTITDIGVLALVSPVVGSGCYTATESFTVSIKNYGTVPWDFSTANATITATVSGAATGSFPISITDNSYNAGSPLASGATMNVTLGTLDMMAPGVYTFNASISGTGDAVSGNDAMPATNRTGSNPTVLLTSNSPVCEGSPINLTATSSGGNNTISTNYSGSKTESPALAIPDGNVAGATSNITLAAAGTVNASTAISVTVNLTHAFQTDVDVYLVGPSNCGAMELTTDNGASGSGSYTGTIFNTTLISPLITAGSTPFTGSFKPEGNVSTAPTALSAVGGVNYTSLPLVSLVSGTCPINGTWKLYVGDDFAADAGTLSSWSLSITNASTGNYTDAFSGTGTFGSTTYSGASNSQGDVAVTGVADGSYTYSVTTTDANSCPSKPATTSVTVNNAVTYYADSDGDTYGDPASTTTSCSGAPSGYVADNTDCDDASAAVNPGATEICGNGIDDNCNGSTDEGCTLYTYYADADSDTYGDAASTTTNYTGITPAGYVTDDTDCDDTNGAINPGATEICNFIDDDCDGTTDDGITYLVYYTDADLDNYGTGAGANYCTDPGSSYALNDEDCDDADNAINPGATEICNAIDDNCDGNNDEGLTFTLYYADNDGDTYGNAIMTAETCDGAPIGFVSDDTDCDDSDAAINPGATEICDGIDNDCDGNIDEGVLNTYYADADGDTYGDILSSTTACSAPIGYVANSNDCDDSDAAINPAATEICNGVDDDCDGSTDEGLTFTTYYADAEGDGFGDPASSVTACAIPGGYVADNSDCYPGLTTYTDADGDGFGFGSPVPCGPVINNADCDDTQLLYADSDGDGFGAGPAIECGVATNTDCAPFNNAVYPGATEICNGIDDDCDGTADDGVLNTYYADADGDTYGDATSSTEACSTPVGYVSDATDCNDADDAINPAATEICNFVDDDCDGITDDGITYLIYYTDADIDNYGTGLGANYCADPGLGYSNNNSDCDDTNGSVNPGATEVCNGVDDDCNGDIDEGLTFITYYADADGDTHGDAAVSTTTCDGAPMGYVLNSDDCDDNNDAIYPGVIDLCNGIDNDCDGNIDDDALFTTYYLDNDGDTYGDQLDAGTTFCYVPAAPYVLDNTDCNDADASINPGASEICNAIDEDCDGISDDGLTFTIYYADADGDTYGNAAVTTTTCDGAPVGYVIDDTDCDDSDASINPGATEICNAMDEDCDGIADDGLTFTTYYADADGDTHGDVAVSTTTCDGAPMGYVLNSDDCDDTDDTVYPGVIDLCNGIDNDCDGNIDEDALFATYYLDNDGDTYGDQLDAGTTFCYVPAAPYVLDNTDCNDADMSINPGASEICNAIDEDCDGIADDGLTFTTYYADADADTYGDAAVTTTTCDGAPMGYVIDDTDCDDADGSINPGASEICNAIDEDCDGIADDGLTFTTYYADADGDTHGDAAVTTTTCDGAPMGYVSNSDDCDDADDTVYPGVIDLCNGIDNDCDGNIDDDALFTTYYLDNDGDTYGDQLDAGTTFCYVPAAPYVLDNTDCNDADASINPGASEICNAIDEDCDGIADDGLTFTTYFADTDADTYGDAFNTTTTCDGLPSGYVTDNTDCDDTQNTVYPGAVEICDGLDNNCDGNFDEGTVTASITPAGSVQTCKGVPTTLTANTGLGYTYQWFKNGNIIVGATASTYGANKPGNYQVQVNSPEGCFALSTPTVVSVLANPNANASAPNGTSLCTTVKLKVSYDATYTWQWKKDGTPIPGANNYLYFPTTAGSYTCLVTAATGCSRESNAIVVTACKEGETVEPIAEETFDMFPNPTESEFVIELSIITNATSADVQLFNIMGEVVYNNNVSVNNGNISESITLNDAVPAGMYIVKVTVDGKEFTKQLILQK